MIENNEKERIEIYEIEDKKYTVVSKCVDNPDNIDTLYDILCEFAVAKLNANV